MVTSKSKNPFEEIELSILRKVIDKAERITGADMVSSSEVKQILQIIENFLRRSNCICYGGTAINNILPEDKKFYNSEIELPDYDFYSCNALADAKKLADIYCKNGFTEVEAKAGMHFGTYKVFVNFLPIADITQIDSELFKAIKENSLTVDGIKYAPPNFLRQSMYLELSRPKGDVGRWEKILKRLILLNEVYPLATPGLKCPDEIFQRGMEENKEEEKNLFYITRDCFVDQGVVFIGGYADALYSKYMGSSKKKLLKKVPDFDILALDPSRVADILKERLKENGYNNIKIKKHKAIGELVSKHIEIIVDGETIAFIYYPLACHSYNKIEINKKEIKVGTIDTLLSFYLAFIYANRSYHNIERLMCLSTYLFEVQEENRLSQKGLLKRFSLDCYGNQKTKEIIRLEKKNAFLKYKSNQNSSEWEKWFLNYNPCEKNKKKTKTKKKTYKKKSKKKSKKKFIFSF
tara:strand:- start:4694 stop:6085 length:1392 start_codon:yes stop_codon:yes gene_type:complete